MRTLLYLLDTNMFSYIVSGSSRMARDQFRKLIADPDATLGISSITEAEIRYGMDWANFSLQRRSAIEGMIASIEVFSFDSDAARKYGAARASLRKAGVSVDTMDLLIASHAGALRANLVSHDKVFQSILGHCGIVSILDWAGDLESI